jgi:gas vesicle protein
MNDDNGYFRGLVTGIIVGAAAALFLTPRRGAESHEELAEGGVAEGGLKERATEWSRGAAETLSQKAHYLKERTEGAAETLKIAAMYKADAVREAVTHRSADTTETPDDALDGVRDVAQEQRRKWVKPRNKGSTVETPLESVTMRAV